jgi:RNA polymerase sigma factor for flagellar operon FliA
MTPASIESRDALVLAHMKVVKAIAVRVRETLPVNVELDDLIDAGIVGLFDAATKFDASKQVAFSIYARYRIKGAILDSLREMDWASRYMRRHQKRVEAATRDLSATLQRAPTEAELAEKLGLDVNEWRRMMLDLRNVSLVSASTRADDPHGLPVPECPSKPETQPEAICAKAEEAELVRKAVETLPERYQKVIDLYYRGELTMRQIGDVIGVNESRVSQIHAKALDRLRPQLAALAA